MAVKYWIVFKNWLSQSLTHRTELVVWMILDAVPILTLLFVWSDIFRRQPNIQGNTLSSVISYYVLILLIKALTQAHFEARQVQKIREGQIDLFLTKPISYLGNMFTEHLSSKTFFSTMTVPSWLVLVVIIQKVLPITWPELTLIHFAQFLLFVGFGFLMEFFFALLIVLLGFWFEYSEGLEHFKWILITLFGGAFIPPVLLPLWLQKIIQVLPFQYLYAVPIGILQGTYVLRLWELGYLVLTIATLWLLTFLTWQRAKFKYASAGG